MNAKTKAVYDKINDALRKAELSTEVDYASLLANLAENIQDRINENNEGEE